MLQFPSFTSWNQLEPAHISYLWILLFQVNMLESISCFSYVVWDLFCFHFFLSLLTRCAWQLNYLCYRSPVFYHRFLSPSDNLISDYSLFISKACSYLFDMPLFDMMQIYISNRGVSAWKTTCPFTFLESS